MLHICFVSRFLCCINFSWVDLYAAYTFREKIYILHIRFVGRFICCIYVSWVDVTSKFVDGCVSTWLDVYRTIDDKAKSSLVYYFMFII